MLDTLWYKQESGGSHYGSQRTSREQVPTADSKSPCALPAPAPAACAWGSGQGGPCKPHQYHRAPWAWDCPAQLQVQLQSSPNGCSFSFLLWFITDCVCQQRYAVIAFHYYCFHRNFFCFASKNLIFTSARVIPFLYLNASTVRRLRSPAQWNNKVHEHGVAFGDITLKWMRHWDDFTLTGHTWSRSRKKTDAQWDGEREKEKQQWENSWVKIRIV